MVRENFIPLVTICTHYKVEMDLMYDLSENDLLEITYIESKPCIEKEKLERLEKILRLHQDLQINIAGIDVVFNLLNQVNDLQEEAERLRAKLNIYES